MTFSPRKSEKIVDRFTKGNKPIVGETPLDVAKQLRRDSRGGKVELMADLVQKKIDGDLVFKYKEGDKTLFEPIDALKLRLKLPKKTRRAAVIKAGKSSLKVAA